jgi:hypothetical protein
MTDFTITAPDGLEYKVTGPAGSTKRQALKRVQDAYAKIESMSDDEKQAERIRGKGMLADVLRKQIAQARPDESEADTFQRLYGGKPQTQEPVGTAEGLGRAWVQGYAQGGGDELVAAGATLANKALGRNPGLSWREIFEAYRAREAAKLDLFRKQSPVTAYGTEVAGAITAGAPLPAFTGKTLAGKMAAGAATGGIQGGIYGALQADPGERLEGTGKGALIAGGVGAAAPAVGAAAKNVWARTPWGQRAAAKAAGTSSQVLDDITGAINADDVAAGRRAVQQGGPDAMMVDASPNLQAVLDTAVQKSGSAGTKARRAIDGRLNKATRNLRKTFDRLMGPPGKGVRASAKSISQRTAAIRDRAYKAAYDAPIDYASDAGRNLERVFARIPGRLGMAAKDKANERMIAELGARKARQIMAEIADDGSVTFIEMPNTMQIDYLKRALGRLGKESIDDLGRATDEGLMYRSLARDLKDAAVAANPKYARAIKVGGDKLEMDDALRLGYDMLKTRVTREIVEEGTQNMSIQARQELLKGMRQYIDDTMANVKRTMMDPNTDAREAYKAIADLSSRASRDKVRMALGDKASKQLFRELDRAGQSFNLKASVTQNSKTFVRDRIDKQVQAQAEEGFLKMLGQGSPVQAMREIAKKATGQTAADKQVATDAIYEQIVDVLVTPRGGQAIKAMNAILSAKERILPMQEKIRLVAERLASRAGVPAVPVILGDQPITKQESN